METFEGKCDPQRLAKLEKRVGAADTPQESFHKSISIFCIFRKKKIWNTAFSIRKFEMELKYSKLLIFHKKKSKFIRINFWNDDKATIVATSLVTPDLMAQEWF